MKKFLISLLCLLLLLATVACQNQNNPATDTTGGTQQATEPATGEADPDPVVLTLAADKQTDYRITYPENASGALKEYAMLLGEKFEEFTGVRISVKSDIVLAGADIPDIPEILIGSTNRPASAEALETVEGINDYTVMVVGNKLVINAHNDDAVAKGVYYVINRFLAKLSADTQTVTYSSEQNYFYKSTYSFKDFTVLGNDAAQYSIVVAKDGDYGAERFAARLQYMIASRSGNLLPIKTDDQSAGDYEILVGQTARTTATVGEHQYKVVAKANRVEILADSIYGYEYAYEDFSESLMRDIHRAKADAGELKAVDIKPLLDEDKVTSVYQKNGSVRLMDFNILGTESGAPYLPRVEMLIETIEVLSPDIISLNELTAAMRDAGEGALSAALTALGYTELEVASPNGKKSESAIFYRTSMFNVLEGAGMKVITNSAGLDKYASWAVLQHKTTNEKVAVMSIHLSHPHDAAGNADRMAEVEALLPIAKQLQRDNSCSVLLCGDLNCGPGYDGDPYQSLLLGGFADVAGLATVTDNVGTNYNTDPKYSTTTGVYERTEKNAQAVAIDHILYLGNGMTLNNFDVLGDDCTGAISDHMPLILDFEIGTYTAPDVGTVTEWTNRY